jgi:hypothetical protein
MSSLKRILSSRANGARSCGPVTASGKQASSLNAIRHGLLAQCVVLTNESRENFDILLAQHIDHYRPADDVELSVVEELASAFWRLRRTWAIETRLYDDAIATREPGDEIGRLAAAFSGLASSPQLALLHRYEARLHHIRQRAFKNIHILRNTPPLPNEPTLGANTPTPDASAKLTPRNLPNEPTFGPNTPAAGKPSPATPAKLAPQELPNEPSFDPASPGPGRPTPVQLAPQNLLNEPTLGPASPAPGKPAPKICQTNPLSPPRNRRFQRLGCRPSPYPPGIPRNCRQNLHPRENPPRPPGPVRNPSNKPGGMRRPNSHPAALKYNDLFARRRGGGRMCN